jgi:hypothetical protein
VSYSAGAQKRYNKKFEFITIKLDKESESESIQKIDRLAEKTGSKQSALKQIILNFKDGEKI